MPDSDRLVQALALGGFGAIVLAIVVASLRDAAAMRRWPVARGRVLSSSVEQYQDDAGTSGNYGGTRFRMTLYRPVVVYEYEVSGKRYESRRITQSEGLNRGVADFAQQVAARYPAGSAVDVRFNPKYPHESVLDPRVPKSWIFALVIGVALLALGAHSWFG